MGFLPGGTSAKLGDRYEGRCCVSLMLQVLAEQIRSVEIEAIGDDEVGVDLWTVTNAGRRVARQCKAFNSSEPDWSIAELARRGVLKKAAFQLRQSDDIDFCFMSSVLATDLENLSRLARDCGGDDPNRYVEHFVGRTHKAAWLKFCKAVELDANLPLDREASFSLLKRIHVEALQDDQRLRDQSETVARLLLRCLTAASALAVLAEIAAENMHRPLGAAELLRLLERYDIYPRPMSNDPRVTTQIQQLQCQFLEDMRERVAAGSLITRPETSEIKKLLENPSRADAIVLHGPPGYGKSGVLYELARDLTDSGCLVLVVRLDRQAPSGLTSKSYGEQLGLPDSPVFCLRDIAAGQRVVLIIDQLDAMRWTNSHSAQGLDVCKQLLREASAFRRLESRVDVVLACRTHDLEHDPDIKSWLGKQNSVLRLSKVEVRPLAAKMVREVIQSQGVDPRRLNARQLALLESVHRLTMWLEMLKTDNEVPDFASSSALLREYWMNRRRELSKAGCDAIQAEATIQRLAEHMESNGCLTAPESLLGPDEKLATEMQSLGMISIRNERVSFGHQSNLDFLIAEAALTQLQVNNLDIVQWCGLRDEQSLFRREQLRQLLLLMADEDHAGFLASVRALLDAEKVRFHFKQLALEALGQITPQLESVELIQELLNDPTWADQVSSHVINGHVEWVEQLWQCGMLLKWMTGSEEHRRTQVIRWLVSLTTKVPDFVAAVCIEAKTGLVNWANAFAPIVQWEAMKSPSDAFFGLYLDCLKEGMLPEHVDWDGVAKVCPERIVPLFKSWQASWLNRHWGKEVTRNSNHLEVTDNANAILGAIKAQPREAWDALWPMLLSLADKRIRARRKFERQHGPGRYWPDRWQYAIPRMLRRTIIESGRQLARLEPELIQAAARTPLIKHSKLLRVTIARILCRMPSAQSDFALKWLLEDERRLYCGNNRGDRWKPTALLIRRHSRRCSLEVFRELEARLLKFHDPIEKRLGVNWLQATRSGIFFNRFGEGQHVLLTALNSERRLAETTGRIGVFDRKFGPVDLGRKRIRHHAGFTAVLSPVDQRLDRLSDATWLKLVTNNSLPEEDTRWREVRDGYIEASVAQFASSLGRAAARQPQRFAEMALRFPPDIHPQYVGQLIYNLMPRQAPDSVPKDQKENWEPASDDEVRRVLEHFPLSTESSALTYFCWTLRDRPQLLSDALVGKLRACLCHQNPKDGWSELSRSGTQPEEIESLETTALNSVRAVAVLAVASVIWEQPDWFTVFKAEIEQLVRDPHPAVRIAALEACAAAWKVGQPNVCEWLFAAIESDPRVAACHRAREFYNSLFPKHAERLVPIIRAMATSLQDDVAEVGCSQITARWIFFGLFDEELPSIRSGTLAQRKGVANVVRVLLWNEDYTTKCLLLAKELLDDADKDVRCILVHQFRSDELLQRSDASTHLLTLIHSRSFFEAQHMLVFRLNERTAAIEPLADAIFAMAEVLSASREALEAERPYVDLAGILKLLKRLYENTAGPTQQSIRKRCLDALDSLLQSHPFLSWTLAEGTAPS